MKSYLVLGGEGFIGKYFCNYLLNLGFNVKSIDYKSRPDNDLRHIELDRLDRFDACFFLAWDVGGSKYLNETSTWNAQFKNNVKLIANIIPQLENSQIPFLFVSSQLAGTDNSPYSLSKLIAENYCKTIKNCGIARQWNVYGQVEELDKKSHVISDLLHQAITKGEINMLTNGNELRKFIHLDDTCSAYLKIIEILGGNVFDVSTDTFISILDVALIISKLTGAKVIKGSSEGRNMIQSEVSKLPGWTPRITLEQGIKKMIDEY
jgi:nucleoside-diphosphate-sugar epimerase